MNKNLRIITIMKQKKIMKKSNHRNAAKTRRQRDINGKIPLLEI